MIAPSCGHFKSEIKVDIIVDLFFVCVCPPLGLLPVLGPRYMTPTLDSALLISSRVGALIIRLSRHDHRSSISLTPI